MKIVPLEPKHQESLMLLYLKVAASKKDIARLPNEINSSYIRKILDKGLGFVCVEEGAVIAEIHAFSYGLEIFEHILTDVTLLVHPEFQGQGIGKKIFKHFLEFLKKNKPTIYRVELESRATNSNSIKLYESLGFVKEGCMKNKTLNVDQTFEDSFLFAWFNEDYVKRS